MINCPLCKTTEVQEVQYIKSAELDGSLLYNDIRIMFCTHCNHVFNDYPLSSTDMVNYYATEYKKNKFTQPKGSTNQLIKKENGQKSYEITQNNIDDFIINLIDINENEFDIKEKDKVDLIILDHVLEHCWNIDNVIANIKKLIKVEGKVYFNVPDFQRYRNYSGIPYMFLIKEHIHHFNWKTMLAYLQKHGLALVTSRLAEIMILDGAVDMPTIELLMKYAPQKEQKVYCYGAGREFFYNLSNSTIFKISDVTGIIDDTPEKKGKVFKGIVIENSSIIPALSDNDIIYVTAVLQKDKVIKKIKDLGFKGTIKTDIL